MNISDRVFGSDFDPLVKDKLKARQLLNAGVEPNEPITTSDEFTESDPLANHIYKKHNFQGEYEMGSRIPWCRMWTVVSLYTVDNSDIQNPVKGDSFDQKIYLVGNNVLDDYYQNNNPTDSVQPQFLGYNEYMKPKAGITNISTTVSGYLGTVKNTVVNFIVHNYHDYANIFDKYFLRPGAQVFVDMGWDTAHVYNPSVEFENNSSFEGMETAIFGAENELGYVQKSEGDLESIVGYVTKFDAKANVDGGFDCSITIVSKNYAVIDHEPEGRSQVDTSFKSTVTNVAIKRVAETLGLDDIYDLDWIVSSKASGEWKKAVAKAVSSNSEGQTTITGFKYPLIPDISYETGVYFQYLDDGEKKDGEKKIPALNSNLYVSLKFFEEEFLNKEFGINHQNSDNDVGFNSSAQFANFDENLYKKQLYTKNRSSLPFLYPTKDYGALKSAGKIPMRDLFISVSSISGVLTDKTKISTSLQSLLDSISASSDGIMNLKLFGISADRGFAIVDINSPTINPKIKKWDSDNKIQAAASEQKQFDELFIFKPYSPNSMMSDVEISLEMANGGMANMMAIQGMSGDSKAFPVSENIIQNLALRGINTEDADVRFEYLPQRKQEEKEEVEKAQEKEIYVPDESTLIEDATDDAFQSSNSDLLDKINNVYRGDKSEAVDYIGKINEEYNAAVSASKDAKVESEKNKYKDEPSTPGVMVANRPSQYFSYKIKKDMISNNSNIDIILPYRVSFTLYGISGLYPGNSFKVDYLPKKYTDKTFFVMTKVDHELDSSGWKTKCEGQMRMRSDKISEETLDVQVPKVKMSKKALQQVGYDSEQIENIWSEDKNWEEIAPNPPTEE